MRRAHQVVPIQNEATFLRAEALTLLVREVEAGERAGRSPSVEEGRTPPKSVLRTLIGPRRSRLWASRSSGLWSGGCCGRPARSRMPRLSQGKHPDKLVPLDRILYLARDKERKRRAAESARAAALPEGLIRRVSRFIAALQPISATTFRRERLTSF